MRDGGGSTVSGLLDEGGVSPDSAMTTKSFCRFLMWPVTHKALTRSWMYSFNCSVDSSFITNVSIPHSSPRVHRTTPTNIETHFLAESLTFIEQTSPTCSVRLPEIFHPRDDRFVTVPYPLRKPARSRTSYRTGLNCGNR